jgi:hypothetical protein
MVVRILTATPIAHAVVRAGTVTVVRIAADMRMVERIGAAMRMRMRMRMLV